MPPPFVAHQDPSDRTFHAFSQDLEAAARSAFPPTPPRYSKVGVLLVSWANDDTGASALEAAYEEVLGGIYNYSITRYVIPDIEARQASHALSRACHHWGEPYSNDENSLALLVYNGHATLGVSSADLQTPAWQLYGTRRTMSRVTWRALEVTFDLLPCANMVLCNGFPIAEMCECELAAFRIDGGATSRAVLAHLRHAATENRALTAAALHAAVCRERNMTPAHAPASVTFAVHGAGRDNIKMTSPGRQLEMPAGRDNPVVLLKVAVRGEVPSDDVWQRWLLRREGMRGCRVALQGVLDGLALVTVPFEIFVASKREPIWGCGFEDVVRSEMDGGKGEVGEEWEEGN